jgi:hypothetical protein
MNPIANTLHLPIDRWRNKHTFPTQARKKNYLGSNPQAGREVYILTS